MEIANISMWKNRQSEPQTTSSNIQRQPPDPRSFCGCISFLYLTETSWQAVAVSQLEGKRKTLYIWKRNRKKVILSSWKNFVITTDDQDKLVLHAAFDKIRLIF